MSHGPCETCERLAYKALSTPVYSYVPTPDPNWTGRIQTAAEMEVKMSHGFPRRRDVRDMCEEMLLTLMANYDNETEEFDRKFLTDIRDMMREGVPFTDAVGFFVPSRDPEFALDEFACDVAASDLFPAPTLTIDELRGIREQLRQLAVQPDPEGNYNF